MPHDDLILTLTPPETAPPQPDVMTRVLRLPTASRARARAIVKLQLDRLSPLPPEETLFDLVPLRQDGTEHLHALAIARRSQIQAVKQRDVLISRKIEDDDIVFRFRNSALIAHMEERWLRNAPEAALAMLGLAALLLAGALKTQQWRDVTLAEYVKHQQQAAIAARRVEDQKAARAEWTALNRTDASTRLLCVLARIGQQNGASLLVMGLEATTFEVVVRPADTITSSALSRAGGEASPEAVSFSAETCS